MLVVLSNLLLPHDSALYVGSNTVTLLAVFVLRPARRGALIWSGGYLSAFKPSVTALVALSGGYPMGTYLMRQIGFAAECMAIRFCQISWCS